MGSSWISILILLLTYFTTPSLSAQDAYQILESNNFPKGLLPRDATLRSFDASSKKVNITLDEPCELKSQNMRFDRVITFVIKKDSLTKVEGIKEKVITPWYISIKNIVRNKDELQFTSGEFSLNSSVTRYEQIQQCD
ncbi:unnamed protein product [Lupinus luteus]|uniref:Uncharacterized protein n=1 Tax=Lupinus luteus TaxID=3873 RepID=A0AAV1WN41_LUPLU